MALVDRYEILRHLGQGACGDVYLARDRLRSGREVALKTIRGRVDDLLRAAFEREFATLTTLSVPGVAQVYDFGVMSVRSGEPAAAFFTRTYIDGQPLDAAVSGQPLPARIDAFMKVAAVIAPLHRAGVVHGDIKPGNSIVDVQGRAWLIDFGLAKLAGQSRSGEALTAAGTPPYMAPELLRGHSATVAADIYALGVTLWQLVAGEHPFASYGPRAIAARLEGKLPEIPVTAANDVRVALQVAQRCLAKEPLDRFPSVDELLVALARFQTKTSAPAGAEPRAFVAPRPRGHASLLAVLDSAIAARTTAPSSAESAAWLVLGPAGAGKSLLLRELKWRLQLRSHVVLELLPSRNGGAAPLVSLVEQLLVTLGTDHALAPVARELLSQIRAGSLEETRAANVLGSLLAAASREASLVLFVDDLDRGESLLGGVLRSAIHSAGGKGTLVIATAARAEAPAVRELQAERRFQVPALVPEDVAGIAGEVLGAVDATVVDALVEHAQGLPAALISALMELSRLPAVTPADVRALPPAEASLALTRARLAQASVDQLPMLEALALVSELTLDQIPLLPGSTLTQAEVPAAVSRLEALGLLARNAELVLLSDGSLRKTILSALGESRRKQLARQLLGAPLAERLPLSDRARLAVAADDRAQMLALAPEAATGLVRVGAFAAAAELLEALLCCAEGEAHRHALIELARCRQRLGEDEAAAACAATLSGDQGASPAQRADAALLVARSLTALGRFDDAVSALATVPVDADATWRARVQRELAKIHLRRGDYAAVEQAVEAGLAIAPEHDRVRIELLCSKGMVASYRGNHDAARVCHEQALALARSRGERRDEASVLAYLAIGCQRCGDMTAARDLLGQSLDIARELGDVGNMATFSMNLGAVYFYLGEPALAAEHYESAIGLARRAGRSSTQAQARNNLAHLHIYFGLYERARVEIDEVRQDAEAAGHKFIAAQATALLADLLSRTGQVDQALIQYDDAIARYARLGQMREVAEHHLDAAEALLDRGGPVDASAAAGRLSTAREYIEREKIEDLRLRMELLVARARIANGDADAAVQSLQALIERARKARDRDVEWSALAACALGHEALGGSFAARRDARLAVEVLEDIAMRIPREHREAFWHDPRRRAARQRATEDTPAGAPSERSESHPTLLDPRAERERMLEIIKRLASEHDLDRLLERITESAVDLSGAERGSVLLVDATGRLEPHITRARTAAQEQSHITFSRSIAEAVLIDGEPIVTVDATVDGRLQEYVSVHKLMLRSVACLPIRGRSGTVGVLYLEHRRSRGRFSEAAVDMLSALADQAAIAIENARLLAEVRAQKDELEAKNHELAQAKADVEDLLLARTRQLDDVQRELSRARERVTDGLRHGMVGRSPQLQRVFDAIERLCAASVSVVIRGESGTGKELVARAIHYAGPRAKAPFVAINCGSLPETLLESELFGHVKGAFSGADRDKRGMIAAASGGTLFLDEVSDMPAKMQVDLLRVLQEGKLCRVGSEVEEPVDVRVVTATQRALSDLVAAGTFREDLYYRLSVVELVLPALRERRDDIPLLCEHFLRAFAERQGMSRHHLSRAALAKLMEQPWPGNIRQLEHVLLQACVMAEAATIDEADLGLGRAAPSSAPEPALALGGPRIESLDHHKNDEKQRILDALHACGWNRARAAQTLGMPRRTFYRRLTDYSIL